jgi:hypothetical protein
MAGSFPTLKSGNTVFYPLKNTHSFGTGVLKFLDDTEQRWRARNMLRRFELALNKVNGYDSSLVLQFFRSQFGKFDSTWDITIGGVTHSNLAFTNDSFDHSEDTKNRHTLKFNVIQVKSALPTIPSTSKYFPQINSGGIMTSLPYSASYAYRTDVGEMLTGKQYAWKWRANPIGSFNIRLTSITDTELAKVQNFFYSMEGRKGTFQLMDPGGNLVRFSDDFTNVLWVKTSATVGAAQTDPFNGTLARRITSSNNAAALESIVLPEGFANGYVLCASAYVKAIGSGQQLAIGFSEPTNQVTVWNLPQGRWQRIYHVTTLVSDNIPVKMLIGGNTTFLSGQAIDLFSAQVTPLPGPGPRLLTPGFDGLRTKCRFDTDDFAVTHNAFNDNSVDLPVVEFV